jgi:hypothetical protein
MFICICTYRPRAQSLIDADFYTYYADGLVTVSVSCTSGTVSLAPGTFNSLVFTAGASPSGGPVWGWGGVEWGRMFHFRACAFFACLSSRFGRISPSSPLLPRTVLLVFTRIFLWPCGPREYHRSFHCFHALSLPASLLSFPSSLSLPPITLLHTHTQARPPT